MTETEKKRGQILAKAIMDRNFDVPEYIRDMVDCATLLDLMGRRSRDEFIYMYENHHFFREFCEDMQDVMLYKDEFYRELIQNHKLWVGLFLFNDSEWREMVVQSYYVKDANGRMDEDNEPRTMMTDEELLVVLDKAMTVPSLHFQIQSVFDCINLYEKDLIEHFKDKVFLKDLVNALYEVGANRKRSVINACVDAYVPVLYKNFDCTDLYIYLQTVIHTRFTGRLDDSLANIGGFFEENEYYMVTEEFLDMLRTIGAELNQNNLKYYYLAKREKEPNVTTLIDILKKDHQIKMKKDFYLEDFNDLITILGNNASGFSMSLQEVFLENGGDIKTMFDEDGHLLPEATIIRTEDRIPFLFQKLSDDDIEFLLLNSSEFIKNLTSSTWIKQDHLTRILGIMFKVPVDEELWKVINAPVSKEEYTDYRAVLVNRIIASLSKESAMILVPATAAYIEPTVVFVSRNLTSEYVKIFPIKKFSPYIKDIIGRSNYTRFNLFCDGSTISIAKALNDVQFVIDMLVKDKKYGYLCDMEGEDVEEIINTIVSHMD